LQLAQEKWGGVKLNGSDEYKRRCAEIAASNGIRITNPELQGLIKENGGVPRPDAAGVIPEGGRYIAAQAISIGHMIMHSAEKDDLPALETLQGRRAVFAGWLF
jgi:hypothetical protein